MSILVLNAGSSSLRFTLFDDGLKELYKGHVDGIAQKTCNFNGTPLRIRNHKAAIRFALKKMVEDKIITGVKDIKKVAHRVVHGGEKYTKPTKLNPTILKDLEDLSSLAPLHNPANILTIRASQKALPHAAHFAIFDTAFHSTLPEKNFLYGLPYSFYKKDAIRRYGFHGTSHKYVSREAARLLKKPQAKLITCHMGNGVSLAAIANGVSVDTTMGFTPLEGPIMGTRSGSIDPGLLFHLLHKTKPAKLEQILQHESGFKGISEIGSDIRQLWAKPKATGTLRTFDLFCHQMAKLIMSLSVSLGGLPDAIVFTAGIGENAFYLRAQIAAALKPFGVRMNTIANKRNSTVISDKKSTVKLLVIPTNEELQMAQEIA